jgi:hypothetical protein
VSNEQETVLYRAAARRRAKPREGRQRWAHFRAVPTVDGRGWFLDFGGGQGLSWGDELQRMS